MTLDKIIYIASLIGRLQTLVIGVITILIIIAGTLGLMGALEFDDDKRTFCLKKAMKFLKIALPLSIIILFIPSRNEMFSMFLTKGYQKEEIYKMTKEELKDNIDYLVNSLEKIGDKNDWDKKR